MSLYDQFFSDINKEFMFTMANNVLKKDHNIIIEGDENIKNIYLKLSFIFNSTYFSYVWAVLEAKLHLYPL